MTPDQYRAALARLGHHVHKPPPELQISPRTSQRYALGENARGIPAGIAYMLSALLRAQSTAGRARGAGKKAE